jgi:hypothetical protein
MSAANQSEMTIRLIENRPPAHPTAIIHRQLWILASRGNLNPTLQTREVLSSNPAEHLTFLTTRAGAPFKATAICVARRACHLAYRPTACARPHAGGLPRLDVPPMRSPRFPATLHCGKSSGTRKPRTKNGWQRPRWQCPKSKPEQTQANL